MMRQARTCSLRPLKNASDGPLTVPEQRPRYVVVHFLTLSRPRMTIASCMVAILRRRRIMGLLASLSIWYDMIATTVQARNPSH